MLCHIRNASQGSLKRELPFILVKNERETVGRSGYVFCQNLLGPAVSTFKGKRLEQVVELMGSTFHQDCHSVNYLSDPIQLFSPSSQSYSTGQGTGQWSPNLAVCQNQEQGVLTTKGSWDSLFYC